MDDRQLQEWVERVSLESFGRPFLHRATFNRRLRSSGGRYFTRSHNIDISWLQYVTHGAEEVERIIKHELCHYHLHLAKGGYQHRDSDFKELLAIVGGSRYCQPIAAVKRTEPYRYRLECTNCQMVYMRKRKLDIKKYGCGRCRSRLRLIPLSPQDGTSGPDVKSGKCASDQERAGQARSAK
ncbi:SprT family protein [Paenibacillus sp. y28]|uniref:SprT family protein n=1 Tax=Paenibacillus sp. y28 TaxID=3129110 RepID=UPI00301B613B